MARESDTLDYHIEYLKLTEDEKHYHLLDEASKGEATIIRLRMWENGSMTQLELKPEALGPHWDILYVEKIIALMRAAYVQGRAHARADLRQALGVVGGGGFSGSVYLR